MNHRFVAFLAILIFGMSMPLRAEPPAKVRFHFKSRGTKVYLFETNSPALAARKPSKNDWIKGEIENDPENFVEASSRVLLQVKPGANLKKLLDGSSLERDRTIAENTYILQSPDPLTALREAERLSQSNEVTVCTPVMRESLHLHAFTAPIPNDPYWTNEWHLENRDTNGAPSGLDLNARAAWALTRGSGVGIGIGDDGVEMSHPDLASRGVGMPHFDFTTGIADGSPIYPLDKHATPIAGLAVAEMNNNVGVVGVAPEAKFASWKIFNNGVNAASNEQLMDMFQYANNSVAVQNHSWGNKTFTQTAMPVEAILGVEAAVNSGRNGKGVVIVRSIPERRNLLGDANDDEYPSNPQVIAVAGLLSNGRYGSQSDPGASILVGAAGGEFGSTPSLFTTDRQGIEGYNTEETLNGGDYSYPDGRAQSGTSFAAPQIAGVAALVLSANTNLGYRDVQQILLQSARHFEPADSDLSTNGAGFVVSHNDGFGVPDAGLAVSLASIWPNRPALTSITIPADQTNSVTADDDGLRVLIPDGLTNLTSIAASPSVGLHPDAPTDVLPLVDVGLATNTITTNLTGKAALIQRGGTTNAAFSRKLQFAAEAGASFAVVYNNTGTNARTVMTSLEYTPIPAVFIGKNDGDALSAWLQTNSASAQLKCYSTNMTFTVTNQLLCEHVQVSTEITCRRGDVRLTLISPQGTRSVLQRVNFDTNSYGLVVWTYATTHHFYESSVGTWTLEMADESPGATTILQTASLIIHGVQITDTDDDGLDDNWEIAKFGQLGQGPTDNPDNDAYNNMREQIMGTNPNAVDAPVITQQPASQIVFAGSNATFQVAASGMQPFDYQWRFEGSDITGATDSSLSLTNINGSQLGNYSVVISNRNGSVVSSNATLRFYTPGSLAGMTLTLNVTNGTGTLATNGSFLLVFSAFDNSYRLISLTSGTNVSGTYIYSTWLSDAAIDLDSTNTIWLGFDSVDTGHFLLEASGSDTQTGTFALLPSGPDFNSDGRVDLLFQHTNRVLTTWLMSGTNFLKPALIRNGTPAGIGWRATALADFNADGQTDLLFQNDNGKMAVWFLNQTNLLSTLLLRGGAAIGPGWKSVSVADLDSDGQKDILFQHDKGSLAAWLMNKTNFIRAISLRGGKAAGPGWHAFGTADFDGDAQNDILFQHDKGQLAVWTMKGTNFVSSELLRNGTAAGPGWRALGIADLNSDGRYDIMFQNTNSNAMAVWFFNRKTFAGTSPLRNGTPVGPGWKLVGPK